MANGTLNSFQFDKRIYRVYESSLILRINLNSKILEILEFWSGVFHCYYDDDSNKKNWKINILKLIGSNIS